jgi:hypothetical protein
VRLEAAGPEEPLARAAVVSGAARSVQGIGPGAAPRNDMPWRTRWPDKIAIVTGPDTWIGETPTEEFAKEGATRVGCAPVA